MGRVEEGGSPLGKVTWDERTGEAIWSVPWRDDLPHSCRVIEYRNGGRTFYLCGTFILASLTPDSSELKQIEVPEGYFVERGIEDYGMALWLERSREHGVRIRGWAPDGNGPRVVLETTPGDTCHIGLSTDKIVGTFVDGRYECSPREHPIRLWSASRNTEEPGFNVSPAFNLDLQFFDAFLVTHGDFIGMRLRTGQSGPEYQILISRISDWKTRLIEPPPGYDVSATALTDTHLYVLHSGYNAVCATAVHDIYRYELARFEDMGVEVHPSGR